MVSDMIRHALCLIVMTASLVGFANESKPTNAKPAAKVGNNASAEKPAASAASSTQAADNKPSAPPTPQVPTAQGNGDAAKPAQVEKYDPSKYRGVAVMDAANKLQYVAENPTQTHSKENFVLVKVKGFKTRGEKEKGRIRVAVWDSESNYAKEGTTPFRASSYFAKEAPNGEMLFKIGGLEKGKSYSFFAHFDKEDRGYVKKILGIPTDPFLFSNAQTQGKGKGLTREGLSPPKFANTLVKFNEPGQEILMEF